MCTNYFVRYTWVVETKVVTRYLKQIKKNNKETIHYKNDNSNIPFTALRSKCEC